MNQTHRVWLLLRPISLFFLLLISLTALGAQSFPIPRLEPDPDISQLAHKEESMTVSDLSLTALIASGVSEDNRGDYLQKVIDLVALLPETSGNVADDGEAILQWMHEEVLGRYVESQTKLDVVLDRGSYNCVSSAVLYLIFMAARDIPAYGIQTADHAFCRVPLESDPEGGFDVETTIPFGFDPGRRHDAVDTFSGRTGFVYVPPSNYSNRTELGNKEMIALIYQNRLAALQRSGNWTETVGLARDRWELAGNETSRDDFVTALGNYSAEMNRQKRHVDGLLFLVDAKSSLGDEVDVEESARALLHNAVTLKLQRDKTDEAREILADQRYSALVDSEFIEDLYYNIRTTELENVVANADFDDAVPAVDAALTEGIISLARWEELTLHLWTGEAKRISRGNKWLDAWNFLNLSEANTRNLLTGRAVMSNYRHNVIITYHNRFVEAVRARRYDDAGIILDEAQQLFPDSETLLNDRRTLDEIPR